MAASSITGAKAPRHSPKASPIGLPFGMESTAGQVVDGDDPHTALMRELNFFPTPPWAARAGGELIRALDPIAMNIWEPACGVGHMAGPLAETFDVTASDVFDHGYGGVRDFLDGRPGDWTDIDWVVTNPPFSKAAEFVARGLEVARRGVAMLCRLVFVESVGRYPLMRRMAVMAPFAERVPMQLGSWNPDLSSATAYGWFVWMSDEALRDCPIGDVIRAANAEGGSLVRVIAPGTCARLTRADDRVVYAGEVASPQLDLLGVA